MRRYYNITYINNKYVKKIQTIYSMVKLWQVFNKKPILTKEYYNKRSNIHTIHNTYELATHNRILNRIEVYTFINI